MVTCRAIQLHFLQVVTLFLLLCFTDSYPYLDLPRCPNVKGGAMNAVAGTNSSCVYYQCSMTEAIVDIPTKLLDGYERDPPDTRIAMFRLNYSLPKKAKNLNLRTYSNIVLVTREGCTVREQKKISNEGFDFVRLIVPYNGCETQVQKAGRKFHYYNAPYIAYIGNKWSLYFVKTSCIVKPKISAPKIIWKKLPIRKGMGSRCFSNNNFFTIPAVGNLAVTVKFLALDDTPHNSFIPRKTQIIKFDVARMAKLVPVNNPKYRVWTYNLISRIKFNIQDYHLGKKGVDKARGVLIFYSKRQAVVEMTGNKGAASISALPNCALGYEHIIVSHPSAESYVIIAAGLLRNYSISTEIQVFDETGGSVLNSTLTVLTTTYLRNVTTGYKIVSDRPILVYSIMLDAKVPNENSSKLASDHMAEQMLPVSLWGSKYVVHPSYFGDEESGPGFILRLVAYKRTVNLQYLGINGSSFPTTVSRLSYVDLDLPSDASLVVKSTDGTNFMAVVIGKSGNESKTDAKPFMMTLQPTKGFTTISHYYGDSSVDGQVNIVTDNSLKSEINLNNQSSTIPEYLWEDISCPSNFSSVCKTSNYTFYQYQSPKTLSSVFFSTNENKFGTTTFQKLTSDSHGMMAHSGPAEFIAEQVQADECELGWSYYPETNQCIRVVLQNTTWKNAEGVCKKFEGKNQSLVTMETYRKGIFVLNIGRLFQVEHYHIGFSGLGEAKWPNGDKVFSNGKSVNSSTAEAVSCGLLYLQYFHDLPHTYDILFSKCESSLPFICQKDAPEIIVTTISPTTVMQTTLEPTKLCETNPCLNDGNCTVVENKEKCICTKHYAGPYCGEYLLLESGVYEVTVDNNIPLNLLKNQQRYKRGANVGHENRRLFEVTRFGNMHAIRMISECPSSTACYGWLAHDEFSRVFITNSKSGPRLLQMIPRGDGFMLGFKIPTIVISYGRYIGFHLAKSGSFSVVFHFQKMKGPDEVFSQPLFKIPMVRYELNEPVLSKPEQYVAISIDRSSCKPSTDQLTICSWYRSFAGPNSTSILPMVLYNVSKSKIETEFENVNRYKTGEVNVRHISTNELKVEIVDGNRKLIAESLPFIPPYAGFRHHFCILDNKITIDGMPFTLNYTKTVENFLDLTGATLLSTGPFLGQVDGLDVWCGNKSNNFIFVEATMFPECGGSKGDHASMQSNDVVVSENVVKVEIETLESACQFCPQNWAFHQGQCYALIETSTAAPQAKKFVNPSGGICPKQSSGHSWPAMIRSHYSHFFLSKYADAVLGENNDVAWFGMHLNQWKIWKWSQDDSKMTMSYWGIGEPNFSEGFSGQCAVYKPSLIKNLPWTPVTAQTDITIEATSPNNYHWAVKKCSEQHPFICEKSSSGITPEKQFLLRIFIMGGSYVSHLSKPNQLQDLRKTLITIVNKLNSVTNGKISYQLIRIQIIPSMEMNTNNKEIFIRSILGWRPFPGETSIDNIIKYINAFSNDAKYRYINILTSAFDQHISTNLDKKSTSTTFGLGVMSAHTKHLQSLSSYISCCDFARSSDAERIAVANKVVKCIRGGFIADEMPYVIAGKSGDRIFDEVPEGRSWGRLPMGRSLVGVSYASGATTQTTAFTSTEASPTTDLKSLSNTFTSLAVSQSTEEECSESSPSISVSMSKSTAIVSPTSNSLTSVFSNLSTGTSMTSISVPLSTDDTSVPSSTVGVSSSQSTDAFSFSSVDESSTVLMPTSETSDQPTSTGAKLTSATSDQPASKAATSKLTSRAPASDLMTTSLQQTTLITVHSSSMSSKVDSSSYLTSSIDVSGSTVFSPPMTASTSSLMFTIEPTSVSNDLTTTVERSIQASSSTVLNITPTSATKSISTLSTTMPTTSILLSSAASTLSFATSPPITTETVTLPSTSSSLTSMGTAPYNSSVVTSISSMSDTSNTPTPTFVSSASTSSPSLSSSVASTSSLIASPVTSDDTSPSNTPTPTFVSSASTSSPSLSSSVASTSSLIATPVTSDDTSPGNTPTPTFVSSASTTNPSSSTLVSSSIASTSLLVTSPVTSDDTSPSNTPTPTFVSSASTTSPSSSTLLSSSVASTSLLVSSQITTDVTSTLSSPTSQPSSTNIVSNPILPTSASIASSVAPAFSTSKVTTDIASTFSSDTSIPNSAGIVSTSIQPTNVSIMSSVASTYSLSTSSQVTTTVNLPSITSTQSLTNIVSSPTSPSLTSITGAPVASTVTQSTTMESNNATTPKLFTSNQSTTAATTEIITTTAASHTSSEDCPTGYTGEECTERTEPKSGVVETTSSDDLFALFPSQFKRRKRSTGSSLPLQLVGINGKYAIRSLYTCPTGAYCLWWLNVVNDQVSFVSPDNGYKLWILLPLKNPNKYLVKNPDDGKYIYKPGARFALTDNATRATVFGFKNIPGSVVQTVPEKMRKTFKAEFFTPQVNGSYLNIPLNISSTCENRTICFAFKARNTSNLEHPKFQFRSGSQYIILKQISSLTKLQWYDVCILLDGKAVTVFIDSFPTPVLIENTVVCAESFHLMYNSNDTFLGEIKKVNVWSKILTMSEMQHVHSATCEVYVGDIVSSNQELNGTGFVSLEDSIPVSVCRYCEFDWVLSGDSCYHITTGTYVAISNYIAEDQCRKQINPASHVAVIDNDQIHKSISKLVKAHSAVLKWREWPFIPVIYKTATDSYQWITFGAQKPLTVIRSYWKTNLTFSRSAARCVVYSPTNDSALQTWPSTHMAEILWDTAYCSLAKPFVCEMSADVIDPVDKIKVVIVMPNTVALPATNQMSFSLILADMLDLISSSSANFSFIQSHNMTEVGPKPAHREFLKTWKQNVTKTTLKKTLQNLLSSENKDANYFVVVVQPGTNLSDVENLMSNKSVFVLGLKNTSLPNLQKLSSTSDYAFVMVEPLNPLSKNRLLSAFQRFLQGISPPTLVLPLNNTTVVPATTGVQTTGTTGILATSKLHTTVPLTTINATTVVYNNTECNNSTCKNNGTCSPVHKNDFSCDCPPTHAGKTCEYESPKVLCEDAGLSVLVSIDIVRSLSGVSNSTTPSSIVLYFANRQNISECSVTEPVPDSKYNKVYKLSVPSPFTTCGVSVLKSFNSTNVTVSGVIYYERVTTVKFVDTTVLVANFTCIYTTKYGVGLRPDEVLSVSFQPVPNNFYSAKINEIGNIIVLFKFFLDAKHAKELPMNPKLKIGTNLYVLIYSKYPLPKMMSLEIESCYLSPRSEPRVRIAVVQLIKENCAVPDGISKSITSIKKDEISFMFQVFKWKGNNNQLHLHCSTKICDMSVGSKCATNCTGAPSRSKRQLADRNENVYTAKLVSSAAIQTVNDDDIVNNTDPRIASKYLVTREELYPYLLAGLIMFAFLFFSFIIIAILHCNRMPDPETFAQYTKRSYRRGRSISGSLPRTWTVVHAVSPPGSADVAEPKRTRTYEITSENNNRVSEIVSPNSSQARFSTFLGESQQDNDDEVQGSVIVVPDRAPQIESTTTSV